MSTTENDDDKGSTWADAAVAIVAIVAVVFMCLVCTYASGGGFR